MRSPLLLFAAAALISRALAAAEVRLGPETPLSPRIEIGAAAYRQEAPRVASNGAEFLAVWRDFRSGSGLPAIYGARFDAAGHLIASLGKLADASTATIASAGGDYLLTFYAGGQQFIEPLAANGSSLAPPFAVPGFENASIFSNG